MDVLVGKATGSAEHVKIAGQQNERSGKAGQERFGESGAFMRAGGAVLNENRRFRNSIGDEEGFDGFRTALSARENGVEMPAAPRFESIGCSPVGFDSNETAARHPRISGGDEQDEHVSVAVGPTGGESRGRPGDDGGESDHQHQRPDDGGGVAQERDQADDHEVSAPQRRAFRRIALRSDPSLCRWNNRRGHAAWRRRP